MNTEFEKIKKENKMLRLKMSKALEKHLSNLKKAGVPEGENFVGYIKKLKRQLKYERKETFRLLKENLRIKERIAKVLNPKKP